MHQFIDGLSKIHDKYQKIDSFQCGGCLKLKEIEVNNFFKTFKKLNNIYFDENETAKFIEIYKKSTQGENYETEITR